MSGQSDDRFILFHQYCQQDATVEFRNGITNNNATSHIVQHLAVHKKNHIFWLTTATQGSYDLSIMGTGDILNEVVTWVQPWAHFTNMV